MLCMANHLRTWKKVVALVNNAFKIYILEWLCMSSHLAPTLHNQKIVQCVLAEMNFSPNKKQIVT
jgi:hypothetical protein